MNKSWQVVLAFLVVFVAGGAIGSVFTLRYAVPKLPAPRQPAVQASRPEDLGPNLLRRWLLGGDQLHLTMQQREKIKPIIFETAEDVGRLRIEAAHSTQLLLENMQDQIATVLTPQQRGKFYQMIQNQRDRMTRFNKDFRRQAKEQAAQAAGQAAQP